MGPAEVLPLNVWDKDRELDMQEDLPPPLLAPRSNDNDEHCWDDEWDY